MAYKVLAGRYEIHEKIGDGGMAVVYEARDKLLNRLVAIKVLRPEFVKDASFVENFRRESRAAAGLNHPNIVSIFDVGREGNIFFIVMELIKGRPLSDIIKEKAPLPYTDVIAVGTQIASALSFAHANNIIHRDVKPHNIMITVVGNEIHAKITDFGIARAVTDRTTVSDNNVIMGSVHYFSPEQARGKYIDERSDIYSLGIVLYEMLTGRVPFDADEPIAIAMKHMNEPIIPPSRLVGGVPPGLEQLILKATEKVQVNRFSSAEEMKEELENVERRATAFGDIYVPGGGRTSDLSNTGDYSNDYSNENGYADQHYDDYPIPNPNGGGQNDGYNNPDHYDTGWDDEDDPDDYLEGNGRTGKEPVQQVSQNGKGKGKKGKKVLTPEDKKHRKIRRWAFLVAVLAALALCYPLFSLIQNFIEGREYEIPDLMGKTQQEAQEIVDKAGFKLVITLMPDSEKEPGTVTAQNPKGGTMVKKGASISVNVVGNPDDAPSEGVVPDLIGKSKAAAENAIKEYGFIVGDINLEDSEKAMDTVFDQSPKAGEKLEAGAKISITVSLGPKSEEVTMPNVLGVTEKKAKTAIQNAGLAVGSVTSESSDDYDAGVVSWQQYEKGTVLSQGQSVNIRISTGPEDKTSTVSIPVDFSTGPPEPFNLTVTLVSGDGTKKNIISNEPHTNADAAANVSVTGTGSGAKVQIYFNSSVTKTFNVNFNTGKVS